MLKYIFLSIVVCLAWALVLVFHDSVPLWPAAFVTALVVGGLLFYRYSRRVTERVEELRFHHQVGSDRLNFGSEIAEFNRAVAILKSVRVGVGRTAFRALPWYLVIGPPGSGKTTMLRSSGLRLRELRSLAAGFDDAAASSDRETGSSRECEWSLANEAIFLDIVGQWSMGGADQGRWTTLLSLLRRIRPKTSVNGALLVVSVRDLQGDATSLQLLASRLRERVHEATDRLGMALPIYLLIAKCDLLPGFVDTFGILPDNERDQALGTTLPLAGPHLDSQDVLRKSLEDLERLLRDRALWRMGEERSPEARLRIFGFPHELSSLWEPITYLASRLVPDSAFAKAPFLRGVYFASGVQERQTVGRPSLMANVLGGRPPPGDGLVFGKPRSYFGHDFFTRVLVPDRDAVGSTRLTSLGSSWPWIVPLLIGVLAALALVLFVSSYLENRQLIADAKSFVQKLNAARAPHNVPGPFATAPMEAAEPTATRLAKFMANGPDVSLRFGLYPGDRLMGPLHLAIERLVIRPLLDNDGELLLAYALGKSTADSASAVHGLMFHLLLTQPKVADEPAPESDHWRDKTVGVAAELASDRWGALGGEAATARARKALESAVRFYLLDVESTGDLAERKPLVTSRVRTALLGATEGDPLADLLRDPQMPRDVRLIDMVGGAITLFQSGGDLKSGPYVPGAFTPAGWEIVKGRIQRLTSDREHDEDAWVLAAPGKRTGATADAWRAAYFRRYVDAWKTFLVSLSVKEPTSIDEVRSLLKALVMDRPLDSIWRNASKDLIFKDESLVGKLTRKAPILTLDKIKKMFGNDGDAQGGDASKKTSDDPMTPEDVRKEFASFLSFGMTKPTGLETYGQILAELQGAVGQSGTPDPKAFQTTLKTQRVKLANLVTSYNDNGWEAAVLEKILMPPVRGAEVEFYGATADSAHRRWCDSIVVVYDQLLNGKYPFVRSKGARDAHVDDVQRFFQPKTGTLWRYFSESLQRDIDHPAGTTVFRLRDGAIVRYKPTLTVFLRRAQEITDLLFAKDPAKVGLTVQMRIRPSPPYNKIVFESGGKKISYFNAKERWDEFVWPGRGALFHYYYYPLGGDADLKGDLGYGDGEWALSHLLEDGKLVTASPEGDEYLAGSWTSVRGDMIHADVKPAALVRAFRGVEIPRSVVAGAGACGR